MLVLGTLFVGVLAMLVTIVGGSWLLTLQVTTVAVLALFFLDVYRDHAMTLRSTARGCSSSLLEMEVENLNEEAQLLDLVDRASV